jgi:DNA-binding SARP family transcriptional activator
VTVEEIAAAIWPHAGPRGLNSVRHFVHELRDRLEPDRPKRVPSSFVVARGGGYELDRARVRIDADEFEQAVKSGTAAFTRGETANAAAHLERGLALYGGDLFAEDPYEEWAADERGRLRDLAVRGLRMLAELRLRAGDLESSHEQLQRLVELEPYDVKMQRELIRICLRLERRSEARRRYTSLRMRLFREFGEELDFDLADLAANGESQLRLV